MNIEIHTSRFSQIVEISQKDGNKGSIYLDYNNAKKVAIELLKFLHENIEECACDKTKRECLMYEVTKAVNPHKTCHAFYDTDWTGYITGDMHDELRYGKDWDKD